MLAVLLLCAVSMTAVTAQAAEKAGDVFTYVEGLLRPFGDNTAYSYTHYNYDSGLVSSHISSIAQTKDGFIWIGSDSGLIRFDGVNFEQTDPSVIGVYGVSCLCADSKGSLWVGSTEGGVAVIDNDEVIHIGTDDGLPSAGINGILETPEEYIYISTDKGVVYRDPDDELIHAVDDDRVKDAEITAMVYGPDGYVYCVTRDNVLFALNYGDIYKLYTSEQTGKVFKEGIMGILPDTEINCAYIIPPNSEKAYYCSLESDIGIVKTLDLAFDSKINSMTRIDDTIYVCKTNEFGIMDETVPFNMRQDYLEDFTDIRNVMKDREGNIWLTSGQQGVLKITPDRFSEYYSGERKVYSACVHDNLLFYSTDEGIGCIDDQDDGPRFYESPLFVGKLDICGLAYLHNMRDIISDSKNRLWFCSADSLELICYTEKKKLKKYSVKDGLLSNCVYTVCEMKDGSIVAATDKGVSIIKDGKVVQSCGRDDGLDSPDIVTVSEGFDGELLAGSSSGGIYSVRDGRGTKTAGKDELGSDSIIKIKRDRLRNIVWIVTSNSVAYMDPDHGISVVDNLPYTNCYDIIQTESDDMWLLGGTGIYIARAEELIGNKKDMELRCCTHEDGMPCGATAYSSSFLSSNGDLFVAGSSCVYRVSTKQDPVSSFNLYIPYIEADGERIYPDKEGAFNIGSEAVNVKIYPFLLNYSLMSPEITYSLHGYTDQHTTVSREKLGPVDYAYLDGGTYMFSVRLKDSLTGSETTRNIYIYKEKKFTEKTSVQIINTIVPILLVYVLTIALMLLYRRWMKNRYSREVKKARMTSELEMAAKIQSGMLPDAGTAFEDRDEFEIAASMDPAKEVGGDFYDFSLLDPDHLYIVIADVSGKGAPAALFMMSAMITLSDCAEKSLSPAEILTQANERICRNNNEEMFVSAWLGILEISTGKLTAASAGHEYPALMEPDGDFALYKDRHGCTLGWMEDAKYTEYELPLRAGAKLFVYTDGVTEATDKNEKMFGTDRMIEVLNKAKDKTPDEILKSVRSGVDEFVSSMEQFDDLTMVCLAYKGVEDHGEK